MLFDVHGRQAHAYTTGPAAHTASPPPIVFIHGAQNDHSVWSGQADRLAALGHGVLAIDLPGHGASSPPGGGPALASVDAMADWLLALLDAAGLPSALLAGHSMGSLIALEAAARAPQRVAGLALIGTAFPMRVSGKLLAAARDDEPAAIDMVAKWSHAAPSLVDASRRLMQDLSHRNPDRLLYTDFAACDAYANGLAAASAVRCPVLFIRGTHDLMTPARASEALTAAIEHGSIVDVDAGHAMMAEQPDAVFEALAAFAAGCAQR